MLEKLNELNLIIPIFFLLKVILSIITVLKVIEIIGKWRMFKKAGKEGWIALIPIYTDYVQCQITGVSPYWVLITIIFTLLSPAVIIFGSILSSITTIYFLIILSISTAKSFDKKSEWAIGLILLKPFFYFALGVGKSKYIGKIPAKDPIMETFNKK